MAARNRPRTNMIKDDNGDEQNLWNSIVEKIRRCSALDKQYESVMKDVLPTEEAMQEDESPRNALAKLEKLEHSHREGVKYAEEELRILYEEPDDLLRNLETLVSVRSALEVETPRSATVVKPRPPKRRLDTDGATESPAPSSEVATPISGSRAVSKAGARSGSVSATIKQENGTDGAESIKALGTDKLNKGSKLVPGAEVFFRNKQKSAEGEGILCRITSVTGEGKHKRYEIQDADPELDENGQEPPPTRAAVQSLIAIPLADTTLPEVVKGKQVLALYPNTTTFYKAELVSTRKDGTCRLRFEGEEDLDKTEDVDRRYVLDVK